MKRHGDLWPQVIAFEALLRAAERACKGKRFRPGVAAFHFNLEPELWKLHEELSTKTYRPGAYRSFVIREPKPRQISAAPYRDRVVHHALVSVLEPIYERTFIHDSYACRKVRRPCRVSPPLPLARKPCRPPRPKVSSCCPGVELLPAAVATPRPAGDNRPASGNPPRNPTRNPALPPLLNPPLHLPLTPAR